MNRTVQDDTLSPKPSGDWYEEADKFPLTHFPTSKSFSIMKYLDFIFSISLLLIVSNLNAGTPSTFSQGSPVENCHKIVMKSGDIIDANIIQINPTEVKYKRCGKPDDIETVISKKDILSIKAEDGEVIYRSSTSNTSSGSSGMSPSSRDGKTDFFAVLGGIEGGLAVLVSLILPVGGMLLGIGGLIFGLIGLNKTKKNPEIKGKGWAWTGIGGGALGILLGLLFILILLAL